MVRRPQPGHRCPRRGAGRRVGGRAWSSSPAARSRRRSTRRWPAPTACWCWTTASTCWPRWSAASAGCWPAVPSLTVLATSRARLGASYEWVYELPGLSETDAVQLFCDRASRGRRRACRRIGRGSRRCARGWRAWRWRSSWRPRATRRWGWTGWRPASTIRCDCSAARGRRPATVVAQHDRLERRAARRRRPSVFEASLGVRVGVHGCRGAAAARPSPVRGRHRARPWPGWPISTCCRFGSASRPGTGSRRSSGSTPTNGSGRGAHERPGRARGLGRPGAGALAGRDRGRRLVPRRSTRCAVEARAVLDRHGHEPSTRASGSPRNWCSADGWRRPSSASNGWRPKPPATSGCGCCGLAAGAAAARLVGDEAMRLLSETRDRGRRRPGTPAAAADAIGLAGDVRRPSRPGSWPTHRLPT